LARGVDAAATAAVDLIRDALRRRPLFTSMIERKRLVPVCTATSTRLFSSHTGVSNSPTVTDNGVVTPVPRSTTDSPALPPWTIARVPSGDSQK
jgi:hypothetical protein